MYFLLFLSLVLIVHYFPCMCYSLFSPHLDYKSKLLPHCSSIAVRHISFHHWVLESFPIPVASSECLAVRALWT